MVTIFATVILLQVRSSQRGCNEKRSDLEVYELMNAIQMMQKGVSLSPSTIWMTENAFRLVAVNSCDAS